MNDKDFSQKAFEDALKASIGTLGKPTSKEEFDSFSLLIAGNSDAIMEAVKHKVETEDKVNVNRLAASIVLNGQQNAFAALVGTAIMLCFHIGWNARNENITPRK